MRSRLRMIAIAAFAIFLMPMFLLHAGEAAAQTSTLPGRNCFWATPICALCQRLPPETG